MSNAFQICLKCFKLKKIVVKPKTTQLVENFDQRVEGYKNIISLPECLFDRLRLNLIRSSTS